MHYCPKVSVEDLASVSILEEQEEEDSQADTISTTKEAGEIMLALAEYLPIEHFPMLKDEAARLTKL